MTNSKPSKFGLGVLLGTILGGLAAFFLSPKSGEENREAVMKKMQALKKDIEAMELDKKVKEVWGEANEEGRKIYKQARKHLLIKLDELQGKWEDFDKEKYVKMVEEAIEEVKKEIPKTAEHFLRLRDSFVKDWREEFGHKKTSKKSNS